MDFALLLCGSPFTVGEAEDFKAPETFHKMAASTYTCYKMATSPEIFHKMAAIPESRPVMAPVPELLHLMLTMSRAT